ncbi:MAG: CDP-alcohol phosphatidyltransferase family protein [Chloroflexi bacterium]|nr:MAG: CDP-alcohol phosphatidyltransferase family protein [Chloroflexota bacterium]
MVSTRFADKARSRLGFIGKFVARTGLTPNRLTAIGLLLNVFVAAVIASGNLILGGFLVVAGGLFDVVDGAVARETQRTSRFGGFFDATIDRYSEAVIFAGLLVHFTRTGAGSDAILLTYAVIVGSLMISYTRARAETIGLRGDVGIAQRFERVAILALALAFNQPVWGLWILAILSHVTVLQRIWHVWKHGEPTTHGK